MKKFKLSIARTTYNGVCKKGKIIRRFDSKELRDSFIDGYKMAMELMDTEFVYVYNGKVYLDDAPIIDDLRKRGADDDNEISDDYLITEAIEIGEVDQLVVKGWVLRK